MELRADLALSKKHYDRWHTDVNVPIKGGIHPIYDQLHGWLMRKRAMSEGALLDVGCGNGFFLHWVRQRWPVEVWGLDFSKVALKRTRHFVPEAHTIEAPAEKIPLPSDMFDYVSCIGSLEHFVDIEGALAEMYRVTKPGGKALFYVPNLFFVGHIWFALTRGAQPSEGGQDFSERYFTYDGWKTLIEQAGWNITEVRYYNWILYTAKFPRWVQTLYNLIMRPWVPKNLSYAFALYAVKPRKHCP